MIERADAAPTGLTAYFSDFVIDFLASLTPGVIFLAGFWMTIIVPVSEALELVGKGTPFDGQFPLMLLAGLNIGAAGATIVAILLLTIAFVIGTLFSRLSPKKVDQKSAAGLNEDDRKSGPSHPDDDKVEFPYRDLKAYLAQRDLLYLACRISWTKDDPKRRTKHFINALKIRILASAPSSYIIIARNEAHVRLASTTWFVCEAIKYLSILGASLYLLSFLYGQYFSTLHFSASRIVLGILIPLATGWAFWIGQMFIQRSFHYQRTREILHILELAHWLEVTGKASNIFSGLEIVETNAAILSESPNR